MCLYAGSLVPQAVVAEAPAGARVVDTAALDLEAIIAEMERAHADGHDVARVHSGDPSIYGATAEQMRRLDQLGIPYDITPGVPAFAAAAAALKMELTLPGVAQTVILTRVPRRENLPEGGSLAQLAATGATLVLHLSTRRTAEITAALSPLYGPDCPVIVAWRVSWPEQRLLPTTLSGLAQTVRDAAIDRTALILVGPVLGQVAASGSRLYAKDRDRSAPEG